MTPLPIFEIQPHSRESDDGIMNGHRKALPRASEKLTKEILSYRNHFRAFRKCLPPTLKKRFQAMARP